MIPTMNMKSCFCLFSNNVLMVFVHQPFLMFGSKDLVNFQLSVLEETYNVSSKMESFMEFVFHINVKVT